MTSRKRTLTPLRIEVPDVLNGSTLNLESLFCLLDQVKEGRSIELNMTRVSFIHPYGLTGLMLFAQRARELTQHRVCVKGCRPKVFAYLERINFFSTCADCLFTTDTMLPGYELSRSDSSRNLLELEPVRTSEDVLKITTRMRGIFDQWLSLGVSEQNDLIVILSEMCDNICEHSQSTGHVVIQSYWRQSSNIMQLRIALCDLGIGIPGSLIGRYGRFGSTATDYIQAALAGRSRREIDIQGNGFQRVQEIIRQSRGTLAVRSHDGVVRIINAQPNPSIHSHLTFIPGTQLAILLTKRTSVLLT